MIKLSGSWVAVPTPFDGDGKIDYDAFELLIERHIAYGTSQLFVLGSAGEVTLLSWEEKKEIVRRVIGIANGRIPVFFGASALTTEQSAEFARYCEGEGADGVVFTVPPYVLIPQSSLFAHFHECMGAVNIPCGIYNNPSRLGVNVNPETVLALSQAHPNYMVQKEAMPNVQQLVQIRRLCGDAVKIMCCDYPKYSIVIPTLAVGGTGTANIGGNIIPEESAIYSRPWTDMQIIEECRSEYFKWYPLLEELYKLSNPIVLKAALKILGFPGCNLRRPYLDYAGEHYQRLERLLNDMGVVEKYRV